jgi:hypothetical protein
VPLFETLISLTLPEWCGEIADDQFPYNVAKKIRTKSGRLGYTEGGSGPLLAKRSTSNGAQQRSGTQVPQSDPQHIPPDPFF